MLHLFPWYIVHMFPWYVAHGLNYFYRWRWTSKLCFDPILMRTIIEVTVGYAIQLGVDFFVWDEVWISKGWSKQYILCLGFGCDWKFSSYLEPSFNSMWFFPRIHRVPFFVRLCPLKCHGNQMCWRGFVLNLLFCFSSIWLLSFFRL